MSSPLKENKKKALCVSFMHKPDYVINNSESLLHQLSTDIYADDPDWNNSYGHIILRMTANSSKIIFWSLVVYYSYMTVFLSDLADKGTIKQVMKAFRLVSLISALQNHGKERHDRRGKAGS